MPILSILLFFATSTFIIWLGLYIYFKHSNKRTLAVTEKFIEQVSELNPTVFQHIKLCYTETSGQRKQLYINNRCDLYLFNNSLAIIRRQNFIFKVLFAPIILTKNVSATKNLFNYINTYKPKHITFKQIIKGEIDIELADPIYKHHTIEITLQGLTNEQLILLENFKTWC